MNDMPTSHDSHEETTVTSVVDLSNELTRAYLSGDGAAVERVMARLAEEQDRSTRAA